MAATGSLSLARDYLATSLANSSTFQTWTGSANATEAAAHVYTDALPPPAAGGEHTLTELQTYRPYALVSSARFRKSSMAMAQNVEYEASGQVICRLVQDVASEDANDPSAIAEDFDNTIGGIIDDLCTLSGQGGYLCFTNIEMPAPFERTHPDVEQTEGDAVLVDLLIEWQGV